MTNGLVCLTISSWNKFEKITLSRHLFFTSVMRSRPPFRSLFVLSAHAYRHEESHCSSVTAIRSLRHICSVLVIVVVVVFLHEKNIHFEIEQQRQINQKRKKEVQLHRCKNHPDRNEREKRENPQPVSLRVETFPTQQLAFLIALFHAAPRLGNKKRGRKHRSRALDTVSTGNFSCSLNHCPSVDDCKLALGFLLIYF